MQGYKQKGCGTHGRGWHTDEQENIALTLFLETNCNIEKLEGLTIQIARTIVETYKILYKINLQIKHPNDIVYNKKKIGGILTQTKSNGEMVKYIVVGMGMNTNQEIFDQEIVGIATSIKNEFGVQVDNSKVISTFCNLFEAKFINRIGEK